MSIDVHSLVTLNTPEDVVKFLKEDTPLKTKAIYAYGESHRVSRASPLVSDALNHGLVTVTSKRSQDHSDAEFIMSYYIVIKLKHLEPNYFIKFSSNAYKIHWES